MERLKKRGEVKMRRWEYVGVITRIKRSWSDELKGLYDDTFRVTTKGGGGKVWRVKEKGKVYYTVSTYGTGKTSRWDRRGYNVYLHYVLNEEGVKKILERVKYEPE
jgi:hypothetical protein